MAGPEDISNDEFAVSSSPDTASENLEYEGANVCRVAALSTMLGTNARSIRPLAEELDELGFPDRIHSGDWSWVDIDAANLFGGLQDRGTAQDRDRVYRWQMIGETGRPQEAVAFVVDVLGSRLERESVAAAVALWHQLGPIDERYVRPGPHWWHWWDRVFELWEPDRWDLPWPWFRGVNPETAGDDPEIPWDPELWARIYNRLMSRIGGDRYGDLMAVRMLCGWRLARGLRSPDPITRSLALAAFPPPDETPAPEPASSPAATPPGALVVSTMIHGTWGWKGNWWRPRGEFHEFILRNHRPNLYSRGAKFSWSGAYSEPQRALAAEDFGEWAYDVAPHGLQSVFAHSYGGEVAARAVVNGARVSELVLLSVPVTSHVEAAANSSAHIIDVRLRFDPVLGLARTRQRIDPRPNVTEVLLRRWRYDHGSSHRQDVWQDEDVARRGGI